MGQKFIFTSKATVMTVLRICLANAARHSNVKAGGKEIIKITAALISRSGHRITGAGIYRDKVYREARLSEKTRFWNAHVMGEAAQ